MLADSHSLLQGGVWGGGGCEAWSVCWSMWDSHRACERRFSGFTLSSPVCQSVSRQRSLLAPSSWLPPAAFALSCDFLAASALVPWSAPLMWLGLFHAWPPSDWFGTRLTAFHRWSTSLQSDCIYIWVWECVWVCVPGEGWTINSHHLLTSCHPSKPWAPLSPCCLPLRPPTESIIALWTWIWWRSFLKLYFVLQVFFLLPYSMKLLENTSI